jgi:hypothetical protein
MRGNSGVAALLGRMNRETVVAIAGLWIVFCQHTPGAELKVDLGPTGRPDIGASRFIEWKFDPAAPSKNFGEVNVVLKSAAGLEAGIYKFGIDYGARLACDGVFVKGGEMEMLVSGLAPGSHTITTFHNSIWTPDRPVTKFNVFVNGVLTLTNIQPTTQVTNDYDIASAHVRFTAARGQDVVLKFVATGPIVLNGFEVDGSNPAASAVKPFPANDDEHVDKGNGSVKLSWTASPSATSRDIYFGTDAAVVALADRQSPLFKGNQKPTEWLATNLNHLDTYVWRVDEVDAAGNTTRGQPWHFRTRFPAFPTAEGYGRFARGGRGGRIIAVTNLHDSGPGSLRAAVEAEGPRTVIFNVSGLITLESRLVIKNPYLTIAGQTAPAKGICIRKYNLGMSGARDVIVRHLRVRPGNLAGVTLDGMGMQGSDHCIIDHCSISWSHDEAFSSRSARNITLQRTLISEALNEAGHKKYPAGTQHGYAASISGLIGSFHHNLLAHCAGRNWSLAGGLNQGGRHTGWLDIRNNVVYNWKHRTTDGGAAKVNFINNYYKPGPASRYLNVLNPERNNIKGFGPQDYYIAGNVMEGRFGADKPLAGVTEPEPYKNFVVDAAFFESHVRTQSAEDAYRSVLSDVGCNRPVLDDHDKRVIQEVRDGTARYRGSKTGLPGLPDSQDDVGGWEEYPEVHRPADWDTDHDGMPNDWEKRAGLNPKDPVDGNGDRNTDGYTNLEEYLGWLVGEFPDPKNL